MLHTNFCSSSRARRDESTLSRIGVTPTVLGHVRLERFGVVAADCAHVGWLILCVYCLEEAGRWNCKDELRDERGEDGDDE